MVFPRFKYPWLVTLQIKDTHICGGTLLNPTTVVTAGHCSIYKSTQNLTVFAHRNVFYLTAESEKALKFSVTKIILHPKYAQRKYDVAIWKVQLVDGDVEKIPTDMIVFDDGAKSANFTPLSIAGWGSLSQGGPKARVMMETKVDVVPIESCLVQYPQLHTVSCLCAGRPRRDTCQGDSGGPLFTKRDDGKFILVGVTSYGNGCANPDFSGVYTRVTAVADWITSFMD